MTKFSEGRFPNRLKHGRLGNPPLQLARKSFRHLLREIVYIWFTFWRDCTSLFPVTKISAFPANALAKIMVSRKTLTKHPQTHPHRSNTLWLRRRAWSFFEDSQIGSISIVWSGLHEQCRFDFFPTVQLLCSACFPVVHQVEGWRSKFSCLTSCELVWRL